MILDESPSLKSKFTVDLNDSVINLVAELSPRKMRLAIEIALGKAALAKRKNLICKDFTIEQKKDKLKIGFM